MTLLGIFPVSHLSESLLLLVASLLVIAAVLVAKVGSRLGAPSLLLFLLLGMLAGPDVLGLRVEDYPLAESVGHFAMTIIMFHAGLNTSLQETKPVMKQGLLLSTVGVLMTVLLTGLFLWRISAAAIALPLLSCFLLASVMSSTDSASVFAVLGEKQVKLKERLGPMLELESGSNDILAYMLTIIFVKFLSTDAAATQGGWMMFGNGLLVLLVQIAVGLAVGLAVGHGAKWALDRIHLPGFALSSILVLSFGFFADGLSSLLYGNGLLALYVTAIILGNKSFILKSKEIRHFFGGLTWLMQLLMFLLLGLMARPSQMLPLLLPAMLVGAFMMLVARPAGVFLCLLPFKGLSWRAKTLVSWVGLKGAGPILFALCPLVAGLAHSDQMFNMVFLVTLFSLLVQGSSLSRAALLLRLTYPEPPVADTFGMDIPEEMGSLRSHVVTEEDLARGTTLRGLHLPHGIRVMMVRRGERFLVPHGSMSLECGDILMIIMGESDDD
ncbi:MAG: potassium/proton antiporter [Bacteroidales bacterium]|nr:potassium/proton antiporter [Bacteroidales bacterium]